MAKEVTAAMTPVAAVARHLEWLEFALAAARDEETRRRERLGKATNKNREKRTVRLAEVTAEVRELAALVTGLKSLKAPGSPSIRRARRTAAKSTAKPTPRRRATKSTAASIATAAPVAAPVAAPTAPAATPSATKPTARRTTRPKTAAAKKPGAKTPATRRRSTKPSAPSA